MPPARELRFAFTFDDYEAALRLFRDAFELETVMELDRQGGRGVILKVPQATLELFDRRHAEVVDEIEVGHQLEPQVRIAVNVDDLADADEVVRSAGATAMADPVETPWGDRNRRFRAADGLQLTLFQRAG